MKASRCRPDVPRPKIASSSIIDGFALTGPSAPPDPRFAAYRKDLADVALAGTVITSHYAEPLPRKLLRASRVHADASDHSPVVVELEPGEILDMLDCTGGWAWGYAGGERRVGYVRAEAVVPSS